MFQVLVLFSVVCATCVYFDVVCPLFYVLCCIERVDKLTTHMICVYRIDKMSTDRLVGCKDEQLIGGLQDVQYNGQCHTQLLPQYFVLDRDAVEAAN